MTSPAVQQAIYALGLDPSQYTRAAAEVSRANEQLVSTAAKVTVEEEKVQRATRSTADGLSRLEARLDPIIRAEQRRQAALAQVARAVQEGTVTQERAAQTIARVNAFYNQQAIAAGRATAANQNLSRSVGAGVGTRLTTRSKTPPLTRGATPGRC